MQTYQTDGANALASEPDSNNVVLPSQTIQEFIANNIIISDRQVEDNQIQPASLDLRLGAAAYRVRAGFLPGKGVRVMDRVEDLKMHEVSLVGEGGVLEKGAVYIIPLLESLNLPQDVQANASPKSSTGRLDILTRLITEEGTRFDTIPSGYQGRLYLEVTPLTFSVIARQGDTLNQIRFRKGQPNLSDEALQQLDNDRSLIYLDNDQAEAAYISDGVWLSVDLEGKSEDGIVGYRSRSSAPLLDLRNINHYSLEDFWEPIYRPQSGRVILDPESFYIMGSRERIQIPPEYSCEMVAYDTTAGELRVHYAGFFDPAFGCGANYEINGTTAVLEIRSHDVPFVIEHGQRICRMVYERMEERPNKLYGVDVKSNYAQQKLKLAKQFKMD